MFKSIEYKLVLYLILLIAAVAAAVWFLIGKEIWYCALAVFIASLAINRLVRHYRKFNSNIIFLLNALENGDYSFRFAETKLSRRERELNRMFNRIKDILTKARQEIIENEKFLSIIIESVSTGIIILEDNRSVRSVNRAATELLGLSVFTHVNQLSVIDKAFPSLFFELPAGSKTQVNIPNEREEMFVSLSASQAEIRGRHLKILTLNNIGNELEAREMDSWIRLIRVMTHEIMNSIAPITSLSETMLLQHGAADGSKDQLARNTAEAFATINSTARGLLSFVQSYRQMTGIPKPEPRQIELEPLIEKILNLEAAVLKQRNISSEMDFPSATTIVEADETQISQVLVNLIKNAAEAIDPFKGGTIRIEVKTSDGNTQVEVGDNGNSIPPDVAPHIFIPFFTTKEAGTGIGLSISRYIMRLHGGNLKHHYHDGWTVFSMIFRKTENRQ